MVAQHLAENIMGARAPANGLLMMNSAEQAKWYREFRVGVNAYIAREYKGWTVNERIILKNTLLWEFWNDIIVQLNNLDRQWAGRIKLLEKTIGNEILSIRNLGGASLKVPK